MDFHVDDRDLIAFLTYATRERNLDASQRAANRHMRADEQRLSIQALRELNKTMLFEATRRNNNSPDV
jgi:hypothetical protein